MFIIIIIVGIYWLNEPNRQAAAQRYVLIRRQEMGALIYAGQCAQCHGASGEGMVGSALKDGLPAETLTKIIERGIPHTVMTAWGDEEGGPLKENEIEDLTVFITNWDEEILSEARSEVSGQETQGLNASVSLSRGEGLFNSKGCASCHGQGALGKVATPGEACVTCHTGEIRSLVLAPSLPGHSDEIIREKVREGGKNMPAFGEEKITEEELGAIIEFIEEISVPELSDTAKEALGEALEAIENEELFWAKLQLETALANTDLLVQKAQIEKIIDDVDNGNLEEAVEQLEALFGGEDGHAHTH